MTTPPPIHPLAKEAAERIIDDSRIDGFLPSRDLAPIIQTTALDPVLKVGEELAAILIALREERGAMYSVNCECRTCRTITQWRTLTSPKTGDSTEDKPNE